MWLVLLGYVLGVVSVPVFVYGWIIYAYLTDGSGG